MSAFFKNGRVAILIVNYRCSLDTLACLNSLSLLDYRDFDVYVVDNMSPDDSYEVLNTWGREQDYFLFFNADISNYENIRGGNEVGRRKLFLIKSDINGGFAYGNNIALKCASRFGVYEYFWILNPDTLANQNSLGSLVSSLQENNSLGMVGSKLVYAHDRKTIQACGGGRYFKWFAFVKEAKDKASAKLLDYCTGASMLISRRFLDAVGLMNEEYFLYCEELDWAIRGRRSGFGLAYCEESVVFHSEGASIGTNTRSVTQRSELSDFYGTRSRVILTKNYYPFCLPVVYIALLGVIVNRIRRRQFRRVIDILRIMVNPHANYR